MCVREWLLVTFHITQSKIQAVFRVDGAPEVTRSNKRFHVALIVLVARLNLILLWLVGSQPVKLE